LQGAREIGVSLPQTANAAQLMQVCAANGMQGLDHSALVRALEDILDAEAETPNSTLMDRLLSGARSIVRVRKAGHAADDVSLEALIGRMEAAIKDGRLADVLANAKKLPPKAALAGEDWIRKVEARQAVEQAMAAVEGQLKASLGAPQAAPKPAATEGKR